MSCNIERKDIERDIKNKLADKFDTLSFKREDGVLYSDVGKIKNLESLFNYVEQLNHDFKTDLFGDTIVLHNNKLEIVPSNKLVQAYNIITDSNQENFSPFEYEETNKKPAAENFYAHLEYQRNRLDRIKYKLKKLHSDKRNPKKNYDEVMKSINFFTEQMNVLEDDIDNLLTNETEYLLESVQKEIDRLNNILDDIDNMDKNVDIDEVYQGINFLFTIVKGLSLDNEDSGVVPLISLAEPEIANISSQLDLLNINYENKLKDLQRKIFDNDIAFVNNIKNNENISEQDILDSFKLEKDISWMEKVFLGIDQSDSRESLIPQVLKTTLEAKVQLNEAEAKTYKDRLLKAINKLKDKNKDFSWVLEKTSNGTKTGNIINMYSEKWNKSLSTFFNIRKINKSSLKNQKTVSWLRKNTDVIDFRKLKVVKNLYQDLYPEHFVFSEKEMDAYEQELKNKLGPLFEEEIEKVLNTLQIYEGEKSIIQESNIFDTLKKDKINRIDPWLFLKDFFDKDYKKITSGVDAVHNPLIVPKVYREARHIRFLPKKEIFATVDAQGNEIYNDSGFYNKDFNEVLKDSDKLEYWKIISEIYKEYINTTFETNNRLSYGKFEEGFLELLAENKNVKGIGKLMKYAGRAYKELFFEKGRHKVLNNDNFVRKSYKEKAISDKKEFKMALSLLSNEELLQEAIKEGVNKPEKLSRKKLLEETILAKTLKNYSTDINKVSFALLDMAALQRAKEDTLPIANVLLQANKRIKSIDGTERANSIAKMQNWIDRVIKNKNEKYTGSESFLGKPLSKNTWLETIFNKLGELPIIKKFLNEKSLKFFTEQEKEIIDFYKRIKDSDSIDGAIKFIDEDGNIFQSAFLNEKETKLGFFVKEKGTNYFSKISEEDFKIYFEKHLEEKIKEKGLDLTLAGFIQGILKTIIIKGLAFNPVSGVFNRVEGKNSGLIMDATNKYWTRGNIHQANRALSFANLLKFTPDKWRPEDYKKAKMLDILMTFIQDVNLIQDRKNELERQSEKSDFNYHEKLNTYQLAVDNPEFKNQGAILLAILMDTIITDDNGNQVPIFNKETLEFNAWELKDGKITLKEGFRDNQSNILNWENFEINEHDLKDNQFFLTRLKIKNAISRSQGNYDNLDVIDATRTIYGRALTIFMKWLPEHYMQRFSSGKGYDINTGKTKLKGRYRYLLKNPGAFLSGGMTSVALSFGLNPMTGLAMSGIAGVTIYKYFKSTFGKKALENEAYITRDLIDFTKHILGSTMNYPFELLNIKKGKVTDSLYMGAYKKSTLSKEEVYNLQAIAKEIGIRFAQILIFMMVKAALWDDDDDNDEKMFNNFVMNQLNRGIDTLAMWQNPKALYSDVTRFAFLRYLWSAQDLMTNIINRDEDKIHKNSLKLTPLPSLFTKGVAPWKDELEYGADWKDIVIEDIKTGGEKSAHKKYLNLRKKLREDLFKKYPNLNKKEIRKEIRKKIPNRKKGESYKNALKRLEKIKM